ncbi:MAG: hypothetical protein ACQESG_00060 [Nanobdellota archaeon]
MRLLFRLLNRFFLFLTWMISKGSDDYKKIHAVHKRYYHQSLEQMRRQN